MTTESLDGLKARAVDALESALPSVSAWTERVRPADGAPGQFRWAIESTRPANVAATAYILGGLQKMGIRDRVWTEEDRRAGATWVRTMHVGNEQYRDPALVNRKTPGWPENEPWPAPAMLGGINGYARGVLGHCLEQGLKELPPDSPPPGWPQADDDPAEILEWIRTRPYHENAWGACSHGMRMATYLLRWHREDRFGLQPVIDALNFFYSIQDPETGLWGAPEQARNVRINGTFKLFPLIREQLDLPLPHAARIIDQVLAEFERPDYDGTVGGCDEWDNWYVIALARDQAKGHREEEIMETASRRIASVLSIFSKPDGGLSYFPTLCATDWLGFDMAPARPQGDAMGPGILASGISVCIALLGLCGRTCWTGQWRMRQRDDPVIREKILEGLRL